MPLRRLGWPLVLLGAALLVAAIWRLGLSRPRDLPDAAQFEAFLDANRARSQYQGFRAFLDHHGVGGVAPPWQLWRQGADWRRLGEPAFAVPPPERWDQIVPTLRLVRDLVVPAVGPVEIASGFRSQAYNRRAGGARASFHMSFVALDLIALRWWTPWGLRSRLERLWREHGEPVRLGLGLYSGHRFHVDTHRYRLWRE
jgi:hypothetical protein